MLKKSINKIMKNRKLTRLELWFNENPFMINIVIFLVLLAIIAISICVVNYGLKKEDEQIRPCRIPPNLFVG